MQIQDAPVTKLTKLTKKAKKQYIRETLSTGIFDRNNVAEELQISDRTIRRYLNEIAEEDGQVNPNLLQVIRSLCLNNVLAKAANNTLSDKAQITLILSGEAKRLEITEETTEKHLIIHKVVEEDKTAILDAYKRINSNSSSSPEHIRIH